MEGCDLCEKVSWERLAILETKVNHIGESSIDHKNMLSALSLKMDGISEHIARQNGTLPRLEKNFETLVERISENEKAVQKNALKTKIVWAIFSAILTGAALAVVKVAIEI